MKNSNLHSLVLAVAVYGFSLVGAARSVFSKKVIAKRAITIGLFLIVMVLGVNKSCWAQPLSITVANTAVTQNFDGLAASGTGNAQSGGIFSSGWSFLEGSTNANTTYDAGTGSGNGGNTYSFGAALTHVIGERAFGMLQSGSLTSILGFKFTNNTGSTVTSLTIGYTGEVWRLSAGVDNLAFSYNLGVGGVALNAATGWSIFMPLGFMTPSTGTATAVDGNATANRTVIGPINITGLSIANGATVTLRWVDATAGSSAGMGIDDFTITLNATYTAPDAPTGVGATTDNAQTLVSFTAPTNTGNSPLASYTATATPTPSGTPISVNGSSSPISITGLTNGVTYNVTVTATNNANLTSDPSSPAVQVTPTLPAGPNLTIGGSTLDQGSSCIGAAANAIQYTITNSGPVQADGVSVGTSDGQFAISGLSSTSIAANGGTATYNVIFTPTSSGGQGSTITVSSTTANGNSPTNSLTGTGVAAATPVVSSSAATLVAASTATLNGSVTTLGVCPATIEKGFVYSQTNINSDPLVLGTGVTKTPVSGLATGTFTLPVTGLTAGTGYSFKAYLYDGTNYTYSAVTTFTTLVDYTAISTLGTAVTQNFDAMGTTLILPTGFLMGTQTSSPTWAGGVSVVTVTASAGSPSTGGTYNWGNGTDHAVGALTSGSFSSPNNLMSKYINSTGSIIKTLSVSYDLERYRINSAAASVSFFYSTDGSTWTSVPAGDIATTLLPTGASAYSFAPTGTPSSTNQGVISKTGISISSLSIANGSAIYLRWNLNTTGSNSQGIGVDNINVTAIGLPGVPANVNAVAGVESATITFDQASNGGSAITSYTVTSSPAAPGGPVMGTTPSITIPGLTGNQAYTFTIFATNALGNGPTASAGPVTPTVATATISTSSISGSPFCVTTSTGASVSVPFTITGAFNSDNNFTAQLSNSSGNFTSGVTNIGSISNGTTAGSVNATIPANTPTGTYLIRVVGDDPVTVGTADNNTPDIAVNLAANSIAPATTQNIFVGIDGNALTATDQGATSRVWAYSTISGGPYTSTAVTTTTYTPDFPSIGTYYVVCLSAYPCGMATSNEVIVNVTTALIPTTTSLSPASATAGGTGFTLTVNGTNFYNTSVITWNGSNRVTTFVSSTQLTAAITATDILTPGSATVGVTTPGATLPSNTQSFAINAAGLQIAATNTAYLIDFDNTVAGVNNGAFVGTGFQPTPAVGQLNSNAWAVTGWSDGSLAFGGTQTTGDYARGSSQLSTGGMYGLNIGTTPVNRALCFQPGGSDWAPGAITLKLYNGSGAALTSVSVAYKVYINNINGRSNSFNFSYSGDNTTYTPVTSLNATSIAAADASSWQEYYRVVTITGINVATSGNLYLRWSGADVGGSGSRDLFGLDDISVIANPSTTLQTMSGSIADAAITGNVLMTADATVSNNLLLGNNTITIGGNTLALNGSVTSSGTLSGSSTSNLTIGGAAGTLNFTGGSGILKNLTLTANATATLGNALDITGGSSPGVVTVGTGATLTTGNAPFGNLTLRSDANGTASVGNSAGTISGTVTVERYIPADNGTRAWRILSVPTNGPETINTAWQEGQTDQTNTVPNYGTLITTSSSAVYNASTTPVHNGFDALVTATGAVTSLETYNAAGNSPTSNPFWPDVTSTNNAINNNSSYAQAYSIYIRGDRSVLPSASNTTTSSPTTLRTYGSLYNSSVSTPVPALGFGLVGNPYAAPVDFTDGSISYGTVNSNVYYVWDPSLLLSGSLGHYNTIQGPGWVPFYNSSNSSSKYSNAAHKTIESGEAFFVDNTASGSATTLTLTQASKRSATQEVFRPASVVSISGQLRTQLSEVSGSSTLLSDANSAVFDDAYSDAVDNNDALKLSNGTENFSILRDGKILIVERRQAIAVTDTIFFDMWNMKQQQYQLQFIPSGLDAQGLTAYLQDSYTGTDTPVDLTNGSKATFTVDGNAASSAGNRFRIVFTNTSTTVPVLFTGIQAARKNTSVVVSWQVAAQEGIQQYVVERSTGGTGFTQVGTVAAKGGSSAAGSYSFTDLSPVAGNSSYRIESIGASAGDVSYSSIVNISASTGNTAASIAIYPNPVTDGNISVQLTNEPAGKYTVRLINAAGQEIYEAGISHGGGSAAQTLNVPLSLAQGIYKVEVVSPAGTAYTQQVIFK